MHASLVSHRELSLRLFGIGSDMIVVYSVNDGAGKFLYINYHCLVMEPILCSLIGFLFVCVYVCVFCGT